MTPSQQHARAVMWFGTTSTPWRNDMVALDIATGATTRDLVHRRRNC